METLTSCKFGQWFVDGRLVIGRLVMRRLWMRGRLARLREEKGQSLVELAFVLPIFLLLVVGALEFGRLAYAQLEITNAARAGVAYGMQDAITESNLSGMETAAVNDGSNISGLTATASESCTCGNGTSVTCASASTSCTTYPHVLTYIQVSTQATVDPLFYVPGLPRSFVLTGQATLTVP